MTTVDALARFIDVHRRRPHLLGISLSGILAIALHGRHPDVARSLVLASANAGWVGSLRPAEDQRRMQAMQRDLELPIQSRSHLVRVHWGRLIQAAHAIVFDHAPHGWHLSHAAIGCRRNLSIAQPVSAATVSAIRSPPTIPIAVVSRTD
jgi:pimeloyl-ACP methyl ester carboxylesterase